MTDEYLSNRIYELSERIKDIQGRCISDPTNAAEVLSDALEALRKAKDHLEIRVKERTAELEQALSALQTEIADHRRAEESVKAERQRFNDVLDTLPAYLVLLTPDYHVPFANRFFQERFGESNGQPCFEMLKRMGYRADAVADGARSSPGPRTQALR